MDFQTVTLPGLIAIGVVNVIAMFKPELDGRIKFGLSALAAFAVLFVPQNISNIVLENLKVALEAAFAASGVYKLAQKAGNR